MRTGFREAWQRRTSALRGAVTSCCVAGSVLLVGGCGWLSEGFSAYPSAGEAPLTVQFSPQNTVRVSWYLWDFGDGAISSGQNPSHTYGIPGRYSVSLTVAYTTATGQESSYTVGKADCVVVRGEVVPPDDNREATALFVDATGEEVPYYMEGEGIYVMVTDPRRAGEAVLHDAVYMAALPAERSYDAFESLVGGVFMTQAISLSELGFTLDSTSGQGGIVTWYVDSSGYTRWDHLAVVASWAGRPLPPVLTCPGSSSFPGSTVDTLMPLLDWEDSPGATSYDLWLGAYRSNNSGPDPLWTATVTQSTIRVPSGTLSHGGKYVWQATPTNGIGPGGASRAFYFQTPASPP